MDKNLTFLNCDRSVCSSKLPPFTGGLGWVFLLLTMVACRSAKTNVEENVSSAQTTDVKSTVTDSMVTERVFTFDELVWVETHPNPPCEGGSVVTDSGSLASSILNSLPIGRVRVGLLKGGRVSEVQYDTHKAEADLKSVETNETKTITKTKTISYTYINWFIAGVMAILFIMLVVRITKN